jgi:hypothetical protein
MSGQGLAGDITRGPDQNWDRDMDLAAPHAVCYGREPATLPAYGRRFPRGKDLSYRHAQLSTRRECQESSAAAERQEQESSTPDLWTTNALRYIDNMAVKL